MFSGRKDKSAKQQTRAALSKPPRDAGRHTKAFICYAREDLAFVRANLVPGLEAHHIDCDWDFEALRAGDDWRARIEEVMEQSDAFLFIMSPHSITSPACLQELFFAEQHVKRVVPVVLDESVMDRVPPTLSRLHYSFLSDPQQYSSAIADLASTVNTDIGWVREHTRIATLARRWRNSNRSPDLVLRGKALEAAQTWLDNEPLPGRHKLDAPAPTGLQHEFLSASKRATFTRGRRHAVGILVLMLLAVWSLYTVLNKHRETAVRDSQRLASLADDFTASGDAAKGLLVALRAIPRRVMHQIGRDNRFNDAIASVYNGLHSLREELFAGGHDQTVYSIHLSPDGGQLATTSRDGSARLWDISTRALIRRFDVYPPDATGKKKQQVWNAVFTKDGRNLITGSQDGKLLIWPLDGRPRTSLRGHTSSVNRHTVSPGDGRWLASVSDLGIVRIYDLRAPDRDPRVVGKHDDVAHTVAFDSAAKRLITASSDGTALVWDVASGRQLLRLDHARHGRQLSVYKAIFSPDGRQILTATANPGNHARLYDSATGELLAKLRHKHTVADIAFSRDGTRILTASYDKTAIVWSAGS
ncbi:MAG: TIR domain-containing protein, partial [Hyphomicrobiaceae bacterium]